MTSGVLLEPGTGAGAGSANTGFLFIAPGVFHVKHFRQKRQDGGPGGDGSDGTPEWQVRPASSLGPALVGLGGKPFIQRTASRKVILSEHRSQPGTLGPGWSCR